MTAASVVVECCGRRVPLQGAARVPVGVGWRHVCREGVGCTVDGEWIGDGATK